jgi:hypothetical protein
VDIARTCPAFRMADCPTDVGPFDRVRLVSHGAASEGTPTSQNKLGISHIRECSIQASVVLSTYTRKYVLDRRSQWYAAESEAFLES